MRRFLKFINLAAQLMALIDIGKAIKRWATKNDSTSDGNFTIFFIRNSNITNRHLHG